MMVVPARVRIARVGSGAGLLPFCVLVRYCQTTWSWASTSTTRLGHSLGVAGAVLREMVSTSYTLVLVRVCVGALGLRSLPGSARPQACSCDSGDPAIHSEKRSGRGRGG